MVLEQEFYEGQATLQSIELVVKDVSLEAMDQCLEHEVWLLHVDDDFANWLLCAFS